MKVSKCSSFIFLIFLMQFWPAFVVSQTAPTQTVTAQASAGTLRGQITDPSGAAIANASVVLLPAAASSKPIKTQANGQGQYEFNGVPAGQYTLNVIAQGFSVYENDTVTIAAGHSRFALMCRW